MNVINQNELGTNNLYQVMRYVDRSFHDIFEGGSGRAYVGVVIPFDDAAVFADDVSGMRAYGSFEDCRNRYLGEKYIDLDLWDEKSVEAWQASLPDSVVEEIVRSAREAKAGFEITCRALAASIKERSDKIKFDYADGLSPENLVDCWHALCAGYTSLRHLYSDLEDGAWLYQDQSVRWKDLEKVVDRAIFKMRLCFDWQQLESQRTEGRALVWRPLGTDFEERIEEVKPPLAQAGSMWDLLRSELHRQVDDHFEFYLAWEGPI